MKSNNNPQRTQNIKPRLTMRLFAFIKLELSSFFFCINANLKVELKIKKSLAFMQAKQAYPPRIEQIKKGSYCDGK
ncbi:hypothetical protein B0A64_07520 [Flavobacterium araucananum]|uniref:Uncharacterized protein n=1 Tax=Flavobacterium araucananum TaxID=946678 RepID=A0A227PDW0_9FLAO|nr:hypothetical protein B0A64_07520 [Flavobacterium araucananum]